MSETARRRDGKSESRRVEESRSREENDQTARAPGGAMPASPDEDERMQASPLSLEEIARLETLEELEHLIEEPPEGALSIIADEDVPGEPG
jgi:hypothetical protein